MIVAVLFIPGDSDDQKDNFIVKVSRKKLAPHTAHRPHPFDDNKEVWSAHDDAYQRHSAPQPQHREEHGKKEKRKFKHSSQSGTCTMSVHTHNIDIIYMCIICLYR